MLTFKTKTELIVRPLLRKVFPESHKYFGKGQGGMSYDLARYSYAVFMIHLSKLYKCGMTCVPARTAEFGPGRSLGVGLCALLAGSREYYAFDWVPYTNIDLNLSLLDELVVLFKSRAVIPYFENVKPKLDSYSFPHYILNDEYLDKTLCPKRISAIKRALWRMNERGGGVILS